ncbi:MAG: hypothetical protein CMI21_02155 [Opitutae bacterium]|nr:hypothetical protein [Opitutae bacterium]
MKKFLTILAAVTLACGLNAMPDREGGKKGGPPEGRPSREEVMKKFDKDGDGKLSESERAELRKTMEARRKEFMAKFDKDGDGKLNEEERKAAMAARPKPGEGRPEGKGKPRGPGDKKGKGKGKKEGGKKKKGDDPEA